MVARCANSAISGNGIWGETWAGRIGGAANAAPLVRANHVAALGLDAQRDMNLDNLRIVVDHSRRDAEAREAMSLVRTHSERLGFRIFDFDTQNERKAFLDQCTNELLEDAGESWREVWLEKRELAFKR